MPRKLYLTHLLCVTSEPRLRYGVVSDLTSTCKFLCKKILCLTFHFHWIGMLFMMILKQLSNMKKKKIQEVLQEKSQFREWANSFKGRLAQMGRRGFQRGWNLWGHSHVCDFCMHNWPKICLPSESFGTNIKLVIANINLIEFSRLNFDKNWWSLCLIFENVKEN